MNIVIKDKVGFNNKDVLSLVDSLFKNRSPKEGSFDYGLETHGVFGVTLISGKILNYPIHVVQTNKRSSHKSPIHIVIERHTPLI